MGTVVFQAFSPVILTIMPRQDSNAPPLSDYTEAVRLNPKDANAYKNRGNAWDDKGEYSKARADWRRAKELDPRIED